MSHSAPGHIGPFKILEELGRGGQGVVYLAQDAAGERVAIKCVAADAAPDSPAVRRLQREGEFLAVLDHPNIARVYAPLVENDRLYMVMEYVQGQSLAQRLKFGPLPPNEGLSVCRQIAMAIDAAHRARVVHRDLKPDNIRISSDGNVKVLDFGVAAYAAAPQAAEGETASVAPAESEGDKGIVGTNGYMAPEQMMGGEVSPRADIWAFGCILFECMVGHPLFSGAKFEDVFMRVVGRDADLARLPRDVPRSLRVLLKQCLVRRPTDRLASIAEATAVIDAILNRRLPSRQRPGATTNLPRQATTFVGREREMAEVVSLLKFASGVCITGPGGSGKTRLALEAASRLIREFRDGVWFVDLSDRSASESIALAVADALSARFPLHHSRAGVADPNATDESRVTDQLTGRRLLLVLDQCDLHVEPLRRLCAAVHERCAGVRILMTSRERLAIDGHSACALKPLPVPPPHFDHMGVERLLRNESVRLFVERARQVDRGYAPDDAEAADIADLCRRLEGLPLSVELAGARAGTLKPAQIAQRLDSVLGESPESGSHEAERRPRHSTLDACIRWSFDLLSTQERHILTRLSVFKGGWTLEAAEAVCADEAEIRAGDVQVLLARLVNKSLITYDAQAARYSMLESVKSFAAENLAPDDHAALRRRHFLYFRGFARRTDVQIHGKEQATGIRAMHADLENLVHAIEVDALPGITPEMVLEMTLALARFCYVRAYFHEGRRLIEYALARAPEAVPLLRCKAQNALGVIAYGLDEFERAEVAYRQSLEIALALGDQRMAARLWDNIGITCTERGLTDETEAAFAAALRLNQEAGDQDGAMRVKLNSTYYHVRRRMFDEAQVQCIECLHAFRELGDRKREAIALHNLGEIAYYKRSFGEAHQFFAQSLRIKDELGDRRGVSLTLYMFAMVQVEENAGDHAAMLLAKALEIRTELGIIDLPLPRDEHDRALEVLSQQIGPDAFAEAWARGRELYDEEAIQTVTNLGSSGES